MVEANQCPASSKFIGGFNVPPTSPSAPSGVGSQPAGRRLAMLYGHNPDEDHDLALDESHASLGALDESHASLGGLDESHASFGAPWTGRQVTNNETRRGLAEYQEKERWNPVGSGVVGRCRLNLSNSR